MTQLGQGVKALEREPARERSVANHGDYAIILVFKVASLRHTASKAYRRGGVPHGEQVMFGFIGIGETRKPAEFRWIEIVARTTREHLMSIGLMRNIEDDLVVRGIEYTVQSHRQLDDAQIGPNVTSHRSGAHQNGATDLLAKNRQVTRLEVLDVLRR